MLITGIHMTPTKLTQIQRQSIHECIIESHQQNVRISKDDYLEIGLLLLESIAGFDSCDDTERLKTLETIYRFQYNSSR